MNLFSKLQEIPSDHMPKYLFRRLTCNWSAYDIRISTSDGGSLGNNIFCRGYG